VLAEKIAVILYNLILPYTFHSAGQLVLISQSMSQVLYVCAGGFLVTGGSYCLNLQGGKPGWNWTIDPPVQD
jgi:hypothetical protein